MRSLATKKLTSKNRKEIEELYLKYEWYVKRLAVYISSLCKAPIDDLKQEGFLGIARAFELYNPAISSFLTYAQYWIKMAMYSYAYRTTYIVEIPEDFHSLSSKYNKLQQEHGSSLTLAAASVKLGVSEARVSKMITSVRLLKNYTPLEEAEQYGSECAAINKTLNKTSEALLSTAKEVLTDEEFFVLDHLLALECDSPKTLSWVGKIIGVTKERVRQIKNIALEKIRVEAKNRNFDHKEALDD